ncbi:hypothetical protein B9479_007839 [Cryptococcus floricola]|uniref:Uncharacterized protein n=1 Tax=Cryptococcus floricola TaxID=2591691 RepID=A0A5D3ANH3_9TREE|nr:hypothetical protein B9479_007839 [Cryptococcus floricola]
MSSKTGTGTDFWSPTYWSTRFTTETKFEWLVPACTLVPIVGDVVRELPPPAPGRWIWDCDWDCFEDGGEDGEEGVWGVGGEGGEGEGEEGEGEGGEGEGGEGEGEREGGEEVVNILHLGSGTSILGTQLQTYLSSPSPPPSSSSPSASPPPSSSPSPSPPAPPSPPPPPPKTQTSSTPKCQVYDADYVPLPPSTAQEEGRVPFLLVDALDLGSLYKSLPLSKGFEGRGVVGEGKGDGGRMGGEGGKGGGRRGGKGGKGGGRGRGGGRGKRKWDMVLDKSTIDAISTGPLLPPSSTPSQSLSGTVGEGEEGLPADPAERTLLNVGRVVRKGGRWVSVSYSSTRYDFLPFSPSPSPSSSPATSSAPTSLPKPNDKEKYGWRVIRKEIVAMTSLPEGRLVRDGRGERVVYEPETGIWVYVLERV